MGLFLRILYTCDGSIYKVGNIDFSVASEQLAKDVHHLLIRFGIISRISFTPNEHAGCWTVIINDIDNIRLFCREIGFSSYKKETASTFLTQTKNRKGKSFFDKISLDVITPLSRETKTPVRGRGPIYFEIVPENTKGIFRLLYYPFDLIAKGEFDKIKRNFCMIYCHKEVKHG